MDRIRINKLQGYTVMSNYHLRDRRLTLKAKGLLSMMLSFPDDWHYSVKGLISICKEGRDQVRNVLKELEKFGYLKRTRVQDERGRFGYIYDIYEMPEEPSTENPSTGNPSTESPCTQNQPQLITNKSITKQSINKELNTNHILSINDIKEQISYDIFHDNRVDEIVNIILDVLNSTQDTMIISGNRLKMDTIKTAFSNLEADHIDYVLNCLDQNTTEIKNVKKYLIACLYNSNQTINTYYKSRVNNELKGCD